MTSYTGTPLLSVSLSLCIPRLSFPPSPSMPFHLPAFALLPPLLLFRNMISSTPTTNIAATPPTTGAATHERFALADADSDSASALAEVESNEAVTTCVTTGVCVASGTGWDGSGEVWEGTGRALLPGGTTEKKPLLLGISDPFSVGDEVFYRTLLEEMSLRECSLPGNS